MNNAFGHIPEDLLQQAQEAWDFKTCQRSDGTTYGTSGDCAQKGAKEVKKSSSEKKSGFSVDSVLAKSGRELSKVAGPGGGKDYVREANVYGRNITNLRNSSVKKIKQFQSGRISAGQLHKQLVGDFKNANQMLHQMTKTLQSAIDNGQASKNLYYRMGGDMAGYVEQIGNNANKVAGAAGGRKINAIPNLPAPTDPRPKAAPRPSGGGRSRGNNLENTQQTGNFQTDIKNLMGAFMGDMTGTDTAGGLSMLDNNSRSSFRWNDGRYRTKDNQNRVQVHNSWGAAKQAASAWHTNLMQQGMVQSSPSGNLQGSREIIRGRRGRF